MLQLSEQYIVVTEHDKRDYDDLMLFFYIHTLKVLFLLRRLV